jgi:acetyl-CoA carboxylase carboxyl transferase subunit beta
MTMNTLTRKNESDMSNKVKIPEGLWIKCPSCKEIIYKKEMDDNYKVCPKCAYHFRLNSQERIKLLTEPGSFQEICADLESMDPLNFMDYIAYQDRLKRCKRETCFLEASVAGYGLISRYQVALVAMDFCFMGGSMGTVVGEKFVLAAELALEKECPFVSIAASGGARMHEGILSLMQMAKTSAAIARLKDNRIPYISILADPTFGGVTASFAMLGDVNITEPGAMIGFAGPRVIEQTIKQKLPDEFQNSEFQLKHGMIDIITPRKDLKKNLIALLSFFTWKKSFFTQSDKIIPTESVEPSEPNGLNCESDLDENP